MSGVSAGVGDHWVRPGLFMLERQQWGIDRWPRSEACREDLVVHLVVDPKPAELLIECVVEFVMHMVSIIRTQ